MTTVGENITMVKKRYKLVPPDDGWAYMIGISMTINYIVITSFVPCLGIVFNDFFVELSMGSTDILILNAVNALTIAISSFLTGPLLKVITMRKLAFLSSAFLNLGVFCTVFVNTRYQLIICQGLLQNVGVGILYNVVCTSGNDYFLKKRFFVMNLSQAVAAVAAIFTPWMAHWTAEIYGFRGTLILISAVSLQSFVASALIQPVEWHLKKVYVTPESTELLPVTQDQNIEVDSVHNEASKLDSLSDVFPSVDINIENLPTACKRNQLILDIKNFFDWPFLKKFVRTCACIGAAFNFNADVIFTIFVPQALYAFNWTKVEVAFAISLLAFGDIATRLFLTIASTWLKNVGNHVIYIIGMAVDVLAKQVLMWTTDRTVSYISLTLIGCSRSILIVLLPLVLSDVLPPEQYARGVGLSMLFYGLIALALGPAIGAVRDATDDYTIMFYILNAVMAAVTVAWSIELYHNRKAKKVVL